MSVLRSIGDSLSLFRRLNQYFVVSASRQVESFMNRVAVHKAIRRRFSESSRVDEGGIIVVGEGSKTDFSSAGSNATLVNDGCPSLNIHRRQKRRINIDRIGVILSDLPGKALRISR